MEVTIKNCNNIKEGIIDIVLNKLNIKYGINGTGKSTISKAIIKQINGETLDNLKPFNSDESIMPGITGCETFKSVKIYNDDYVSQYLFLPNGDDLHKNSFEVFIKPDNYESQIEDINKILSIVKEYVSENNIINNLIIQRNELNKILKLNAKRTSINSTGLGKALATGNKIINIPEELSEFSKLLNFKDKVKWYSWQNSGREYIVENKCPFCAKKLDDKFKAYMETLDNLFDKKNVEALSKMESIFENISNLISEDTNKFIDDILKDENPISDKNKEKVAKLIVEIDVICNKLLFFVQLDYSKLKDMDLCQVFRHEFL